MVVKETHARRRLQSRPVITTLVTHRPPSLHWGFSSWLNDWNVHHLFIFDQKVWQTTTEPLSLLTTKNHRKANHELTRERKKKAATTTSGNGVVLSHDWVLTPELTVSISFICATWLRENKRESSSFSTRGLEGRDLIVVVCLDYLSRPDVLSSVVGCLCSSSFFGCRGLFPSGDILVCVCVLPPRVFPHGWGHKRHFSPLYLDSELTRWGLFFLCSFPHFSIGGHATPKM